MFSIPQNIICGYFDGSEFGNIDVSPKRKVQRYEIEFYLENGKTTVVDDKEYMIKKHYIQIAKPGQIRYSILPFETFFIKFDAEGEIARKLSKAPEYFLCSHPQNVYNKIKEIILLNETGNLLLLYSNLLSLLDIILKDACTSENSTEKSYEIISASKYFIEANYYKSIDLKDIADNVHLSKIYFHNLFTKKVGKSPHQYLTDCRIENAKVLLWNTKISISEVAERSGFGCQQYFNKVFKKETGTTPAAYRKSSQSNYLR